MIAAGIALIAAVVIVLTWLMVDAMGWKQTAAAWVFSLLLTAAVIGGGLLIEAGMQS